MCGQIGIREKSPVFLENWDPNKGLNLGNTPCSKPLNAFKVGKYLRTSLNAKLKEPKGPQIPPGRRSQIRNPPEILLMGI